MELQSSNGHSHILQRYIDQASKTARNGRSTHLREASNAPALPDRLAA